LTWRRRLWRYFKRFAFGLALLLVLIAAAAVWLTTTASGRGVLLARLLASVNASIPGRLEVRELKRLDLAGVELRGITVRDPTGDVVARLARADVELELRPLLDGRIIVHKVELAAAELDLRRLAEEKRGLLAAFIDPDAPKSPPSTEPPPYVLVQQISVTELAVRVPELGSLGQLDASAIAIDASFELDQTPFVVLRHFEAKIAREGEPLGAVSQISATLARGSDPSVALLRAELAGMHVDFEGELVMPPEASWSEQPLSVSLRAGNLSGQALARLLRRPELAETVQGTLSLELAASGTPRQLLATGRLETAGGWVDLQVNAAQLKRAWLRLETRDFAPRALRKDLPDRRVSLTLAASADTTDPQRIPATLALTSAVDDTALPELLANAAVTPNGLTALSLTLQDGESRIAVDGDASFDGAVDLKVSARLEPQAIQKWTHFAGHPLDGRARLQADLKVALDAQRKMDVSGTVTGSGLQLAQDRATRVAIEVDLHGSPERPTGKVEIVVDDANVSGIAISRLRVAADGGPERYRLVLDGNFDEATALADITLDRAQDKVGLQGQAHGTLRGEPWRLELRPTTASFSGDVTTQGVELDLGGQKLQVSGKIARSGGVLEFESGELDLGKLAALLRMSEPLRGTARLAGRLEGPLAVPRLTLNLRGSGLALGARPTVDLVLDASLDSRKGELDATFDVDAAATPPNRTALELGLKLAHRFKGGPGWQQRLPDGELDATLAVERLDTRLVQAWANLKELPFDGIVTAQVQARGTRQSPELRASLESQASVYGSALELKTSLDYARGKAKLTATVDDSRGRWLDLDTTLELTKETPLSLAQLLERLPRAGADAAWQVQLAANERQLSELPAVVAGELPPVAVGATLLVRHAPQAEPEGALQLSVRPSAPLPAYDDRACRGAEARLELTANLSDGQAKVQLVAVDGPRQLLQAQIDAPVALLPALSGGSPKLGAIQAELKTAELALETLPLVCGVARGTVTAQISLKDALGTRPELRADVVARRFSLGSVDTLDAELQALVGPEEARAELLLVAPTGRSKLRARLPIDFKNGRFAVAKDAPAQADLTLQGLPVAPLLDPKGAVSYASGTLDGTAALRGSLDKPTLRGELRLKDVGFTATELAQPLRDVRGTIRFTQNKLEIVGFEAHDKDGVLRLDGTVAFEPGTRVGADLTIKAKEFPLRQLGQVVATADIEAKVRTEVRPTKTDIEIALGAVDVWIESTELNTGIALESHPDFVIDAGQAGNQTISTKAAESSESPPPQEPRVTQLSLRATDRVWVKRSDFAVKLTPNLTTRIAHGKAMVKGRVQIERGYLQLMGKTFDISRDSYLEMTGSDPPDPALDITAVHNNRRSGEIISVTIGGRSSAPQLTFRVDDQVVTAGGAFQAIYGSQQSNEDPRGASGQAKAFVGGLTAGLLATTARRELGAAAPILMIEPSEASGEGRVRAGFELDSLVPKFLQNVVTGVYFEGIVAKESAGPAGGERSDARVQTGFLLELYFPRNFFSAGQYGPGATWSVDVGWQL
jgi:autotransporter translocation and assembly factor TamB